MNLDQHLAVIGGPKSVTLAHPHFVWPYPASETEKLALGEQRNTDISIKGSAGPIKELETAFKAFLKNQRKYAITFNSGTSALLAAYFALGITRDDEVIAPAITYHAAVSPLFFLRATPILVDVQKDTWCIDPDLIAAAITPKTKAITVVHQWGHPADMDRILAIAQKYHLKVIEDCSHAHGSTYKGKQVGTLGDVAVFSLQTNKIVFAGEGGILVTNDAEIHDRATLLGHYRDRSRDNVIDSFYQQFWVTGYGLKLRMSPYNAITALHSLAQLPSKIEGRRKCLDYFSSLLADLPELTVPTKSQAVTMGAWYGYKPIYHPEKLHAINRELYIKALVAEGVEASEPGSPAFSQLPLYTIQDDRMFSDHQAKVTYKPGDFPVAEFLATHAVSLPTFTNWPEDKPVIEQYAKAFHKVHRYAKELL